MLQSLLTDRFQLKLRHEAKEMPVYHLIIAKKVSAFRQSTPDETFNWALAAGSSPGLARSKATKESMLDFVQLVGVSADRPVIDKTGITGDIDYEIEYAIPGAGQRAEGEGRKDAPSWDDLNRAIIDAVKDQLGLKLESARDPIDILIVDQVQKPSEN